MEEPNKTAGREQEMIRANNGRKIVIFDSLDDDALAAATGRSRRLDLEGYFGSFVECLSNATIQDSGAFYVENRYHQHCTTMGGDWSSPILPRYFTAPISFAFSRP
jgi:hypothetical protein